MLSVVIREIIISIPPAPKESFGPSSHLKGGRAGRGLKSEKQM
jgi:hypothetical protein